VKHQFEGLLVVIEGIDGSGKTTLQNRLADALRNDGHQVTVTKEPTNGPIGQKIRDLAATDRESISPEEEFNLFHEDRQIHVNEVVFPALKRGEIVIQDRSYFSTVAYQGERGLDRDQLYKKSLEIAPEPDILLVIDLPAEDALVRIRESRGMETDDFEKLESLQAIRLVFNEIEGAFRLDARKNPDSVFAAALKIIKKAKK